MDHQHPSRYGPDSPQVSRGLHDANAKGSPSEPVPGGSVLARELRPVLRTSLLLAGWAMAGAAQAQSFDSVVVFGDSVSDPGNLARLQNQTPGLPADLRYPEGTNFSTNPDWVWAQHLEQFYGGLGQYQPIESGGTNYAVGGARVTRDFSSLSQSYQLLSISSQLRQHFNSLDGDRANPDALYVIWGGANDLDLAGSDGALARVGKALASGNDIPAAIARFSGDLAGLQQAAQTAASDYLGQIQYLQEKGAENIVILNLPPLRETPGVLQVNRALSTVPGFNMPVKDFINRNGSLQFNQTLADGLPNLGHGVVAIDVHGLFQELIREPGNYGFQNVTQGACTGTPIPGLGFDDACGPANSGYPYTYNPNTNDTYLFADSIHPSGSVHQMLANMVTSTLSAPVQVSLAGEGALSVARVHRHAVARRGSMTIPLDGANLQLWAAGALAQEDKDALPTLGDSSADLNVVTLGISRDWDGGGSVGAAVSFGNHHNTAQGATLDSAATLWSLDGQWQRGPLQLQGGLTLGSTGVDIERSIVLGPTQRTEQGSTTISHFGANLDLDYTLPNGGNHFRHSLSAGLNWINQNTDGYREGGNRATAMNFAKFSRRSVTVRAGYGIEAAHHLGGLPVRPHARISYERELEMDPVRVSAGVNSMPGASFSLNGLKPSAATAVLAVGAVVDVHEHMEASLDYTFRTGDQSQRSHQAALGLHLKL
ncbi:hypothetical protein FLM9_101 [Candidatus Synechococcus spongiarum]|uniref:Autotransporter domain-containing protein n=2 Tax=Candidatus Synechococcus spongiarum TaxID=431041 RepID=A0A170T3T5_9SYNE|nr:hypothetical protein FLM9_101 [Candidatus Synechococcus spongiarum]